ncbi:phospholipase D-like domain-containing protein [Sphingobium phenoxybenzoativorans]|nr:phospholipase D-like domain-containing protein [Sphingobium phenoxybenzoativorans]
MTGATHWKVERADRACVIVDAEDYFRFARAAMMKARRRIMLIGWDFDARIDLVRSDEADDGAPETVGDLIYWLVQQNPHLEVFLLRWDMGAMKSLLRGNTLVTVAKWMMHPRITLKLDKHHPVGASHHQKIVVIDDCFAFCGGIDMTGDRWDTRAHKDGEPGRKHPDGTPYKPWHDATTALQGPVAAALGKHARERWRQAGGDALRAVRGKTDCWPDELPVQFQNADVAIARTAPRMKGQREVIEIENLYLDHIARAKRYIYAESQYFASRRIAEAIARRLGEKDGPEIVIINPEHAQGWLEPIAMDTARARLFEALRRRDKHDRFRIYHPFTKGGAPVYVHAKILIVDDTILRVGSSNMNNRSMRLDTECDVAIDTALPANKGFDAQIATIRNDLIAEHLGCKAETVKNRLAETGSLIATIEGLRFKGKARGKRRNLRPYETPNLSEIEAWLADNEVLDPEGPDEMFEALSKRGLFRRMKAGLKRG